MSNSSLLDYEKVQKITVHVQATAQVDDGSQGVKKIVGYSTVVVTLGNLNDNEPYFVSDHNHSTIAEGDYSPQNPLAVGDVSLIDFIIWLFKYEPNSNRTCLPRLLHGSFSSNSLPCMLCERLF